MEYPTTVQLETTTVCNAHCEFCPHSVSARKGYMKTELFNNLVEQIAAWPSPPLQVCPFVTNEPFADPRIFTFCETINRKLPGAYLTFFTNANLLTPDKQRLLARLQRVGHVFCSLHHTNAEDYRKDLGLDFNKTLANVKLLHDTPHTFKLHVMKVASVDGSGDMEFRQFATATFPQADVFVARRINYKGDIAITEPEMHQDIICPRHTSMIILADGRVALCCQDQDGKYSLGDATKTPLVDIFNGTRRLNFSTKPKRCNEPCNRCNMAY